MSSNESHLMNRRSFLQVSAAAAACAVLHVPRAAAAENASVSLVSVGYWGGVPSLARRLNLSTRDSLVPAESILTGDPAFFARGARFAIRGFWRGESLRNERAGFSLDVLYEVEDQSVPFKAWSYRHRGGNLSFQSSNASFVAPISTTRPLEFVVSREESRQTLAFSVNSAEGALKLRPGFYFFALRERDSSPAIDWSRIALRKGLGPGLSDQEREGLLVVRDVLGDEPVPFSYLMLRVGVVEG